MNEAALGELGTREFRGLSALLHRWTGIHLADNKRYLVINRLEHALEAKGFSDWRDYLARLETAGPTSSEARDFINCLTTNKTSFFREPKHFDFLRAHVVGGALERAAKGGPRRLRVWCAASSTGEEPYTIAMVLRDACPPELGWDVRVLATDLDTDVLATARAGTYADAALANVPVALRNRWFDRAAGQHGHSTVSSELGQMITFAQANLVASPFPVRGRFDAIFCRNVMIYFDRPTRIAVINNLLDLLLPGGVLIVGHSESLVGFPTPLETLDIGVYRRAGRSESPAIRDAAPAPAPSLAVAPPPSAAPLPRHPKRSPARGPRRLPPAPPHREGLSLAPHAGTSSVPRERIILGQCAAFSAPTLVGTLLGSCVSVALFDPVARVGGLNHFMLPRGDAESVGLARFGVHAMELLINQLLEIGAAKTRLVAKAFGAAAVNPLLTPRASQANALFTREFLSREGIKLLVDRMGGTRPQELWLRTDSGEVFHRYLGVARLEDLTKKEVEAWTTSIAESKTTTAAEPELF